MDLEMIVLCEVSQKDKDNYHVIALTRGLPRWVSGKESTCNEEMQDLWVGKIPWRRKGSPLQYPCLENPMDRGVWWAAVDRVAKSQT